MEEESCARRKLRISQGFNSPLSFISYVPSIIIIMNYFSPTCTKKHCQQINVLYAICDFTGSSVLQVFIKVSSKEMKCQCLLDDVKGKGQCQIFHHELPLWLTPFCKYDPFCVDLSPQITRKEGKIFCSDAVRCDGSCESQWVWAVCPFLFFLLNSTQERRGAERGERSGQVEKWSDVLRDLAEPSTAEPAKVSKRSFQWHH